MVKRKSVPERGDIVWLDFDPSKCHEQKGVRPALVVSPKLYNTKAELALMCPITSAKKGYAFEVELVFTKTLGVVLADHVRSIDWRERNARLIESAPVAVIEEVQSKLNVLIGGE